MHKVIPFISICSVIICLSFNLTTGQTKQRQQFDPVNANATPEAKALLSYLYSISGKGIVSGEHVFVGAPDMYVYSDYVKALTGKTPKLLGFDFINYYKEGNPELLIKEVYEKYLEGHIIALMWHTGRPQDDAPFGWKESVQAKMTDSEWTQLITPGTDLYKRWMDRVDTIAVYLKALQDLGVPVLWRPFHELNGVWFWWGNRKGPDGSLKLYRAMYDRYVNYWHLNNLIWVWGPNSPRDLPHDEAYAYKDFFPGLDCVDVLAADIYNNDYKQSHYDQLLDLGKGKVIALSEVGEAPTPQILKEEPDWTYFMIWGDFVLTHNTPDQVKALFDYRTVISLEDSKKVK